LIKAQRSDYAGLLVHKPHRTDKYGSQKKPDFHLSSHVSAVSVVDAELFAGGLSENSSFLQIFLHLFLLL